MGHKVYKAKQSLTSDMKEIASTLLTIIDRYRPDLLQIPEENYLRRPAPNKWSKKEIMGHLVDSAHCNIRRFVKAQYEDNPYIRYNQDQWVLINNYQQWETSEIIGLWYLLNKQVYYILDNTDPSMYDRTCQTESLHSIEWLAADYVKHLQHHLHVVLELEPVAYP